MDCKGALPGAPRKGVRAGNSGPHGPGPRAPAYSGALTCTPVWGSPEICTLCLGSKFGQGHMPARIFFSSSVSWKSR